MVKRVSKFDGTWSVSENGVDFFHAFDSREEAIREGKELGYNPIYTGKCKLDFVPYIDGVCIIENLQEQAYESGGDSRENYLEGAIDEQIKELEVNLNEVLVAWLEKYRHEPDFYSVYEVEKEI